MPELMHSETPCMGKFFGDNISIPCYEPATYSITWGNESPKTYLCCEHLELWERAKYAGVAAVWPEHWIAFIGHGDW